MDKKYNVLMVLSVTYPKQATIDMIEAMTHICDLLDLLNHMIDEGLIFKGPNGYGIKDYIDDDIESGWQYIDRCHSNPMGNSERGFRDEALLGIDSKGNETEIKNAVIPKLGRQASYKDPEGACLRRFHRDRQCTGTSIKARHRRRLRR
jgi:hypothetical protein